MPRPANVGDQGWHWWAALRTACADGLPNGGRNGRQAWDVLVALKIVPDVENKNLLLVGWDSVLGQTQNTRSVLELCVNMV